jgi:hypothetical protein
MTMQLIETKTLAIAAASIEFTSIPQDATDLMAVVSGRSTTTGYGTHADVFLRPNGATTNLSDRVIFGNGSGVGSNTNTNIRGVMSSSGSTSNTFGNNTFYIPNYTSSANKSVLVDGVTENNATEAFQYATAGLWSNTSAITSLTFVPSAGNFAIDTTISLYKITKGSDGIVTTSTT